MYEQYSNSYITYHDYRKRLAEEDLKIVGDIPYLNFLQNFNGNFIDLNQRM